MAKPRTAAPAAQAPEAPEWARWSVQLPRTLLWQLKVRAAQERRPIRETLAAAIVAYLATPPEAGR